MCTETKPRCFGIEDHEVTYAAASSVSAHGYGWFQRVMLLLLLLTDRFVPAVRKRDERTPEIREYLRGHISLS